VILSKYLDNYFEFDNRALISESWEISDLLDRSPGFSSTEKFFTVRKNDFKLKIHQISENSDIINQYEFLKEANNIKFVDCISRAAGINKANDNCVFVESPTMLEKIGLEIINIFKEVDENVKKYLVIDSLTNLIIYNDPDIVTEFFYHIINRTRTRNIHTISLAIEEEELDKYLTRLIYLNDKILKVRDSFI